MLRLLRPRATQPEGGYFHAPIDRGLVAGAVLATVTTPVTVLATQAGAQPTRGAEALNLTIYEVGQPVANPQTGSVGGGPASAGGVFVGKGNVADLPVPSPPMTPIASSPSPPGRSRSWSPEGASWWPT